MAARVKDELVLEGLDQPQGVVMDLETFIVAVFCVTDDFLRDTLRQLKRRQRGPAAVLADSEVLTVETVGAFLGLDTDHELHAYFRRHFGSLCPRLCGVHRTTFLRQAASLWAVKYALWQRLAGARHPPRSEPCARRPSAGAGLPLRTRPPDLLRATLAFARHLAGGNHRGDAGVGECCRLRRRSPAPCRADRLGARRWRLRASPALRTELAADGLALLAPPHGAAAQTTSWPRWLVPAQRRIESVLSQLTERFHAKRVRARDAWYLAARWLRTLVSHTMAVLPCQQSGLSSLAFAALLDA